jgi:hypothetical protein
MCNFGRNNLGRRIGLRHRLSRLLRRWDPRLSLCQWCLEKSADVSWVGKLVRTAGGTCNSLDSPATVSQCTVRECGNSIIFVLSRTACSICLTTTFTSLVMGEFPLTGCLEFPEVLKLRWCQHTNMIDVSRNLRPDGPEG